MYVYMSCLSTIVDFSACVSARCLWTSGHALHHEPFVLCLLSCLVLPHLVCLSFFLYVSVCLCVFRAIQMSRKSKSGCANRYMSVSMYMFLFMFSSVYVCVVCGVCLCSVAFFGSVGKSAWKPSSKVQQMFETANRYCEGKVQRILNRELSCAGNW